MRRVRIPVDVHQEGWGHEVWCLLRLLVQHVVVRVADKRSIVRMEKHLVRNLEVIKSMCVLRIRERKINLARFFIIRVQNLGLMYKSVYNHYSHVARY